MREAAAGSERRARTSYFEAPSRRIQMIFMLRGHARDGMVSLEAYKRGGSYHFDMLSLDLKAYPAAGLKPEHIFLSGDSDHVRAVSSLCMCMLALPHGARSQHELYPAPTWPRGDDRVVHRWPCASPCV